ncbi:MAG: DUF4129 domain-containing protein [Methanobacteriota archaeon]
MAPGWRGRSAWVVPALLSLAVVLVAGLAFNVANLDTGSETVPDVPDAGGTEPSSRSLVGLLPLIWATTAVLGLVVLALLVYVLVRRTKEKGPRRAVVRRNMYLQTLFTILVLLVAVYAWRHVAPDPGQGEGDGDGSGDTGTGFQVPELPRIAGIPLVAFLAAAVLASLVALATFLKAGPQGRPLVGGPPPAPRPGREEAAATVAEAIRRIELGGDIRGAILLCFHRFSLLLGARGIRDQDVLTPRELEGLAIDRLRVSADAAEDLTGLFEEARYSTHPLGETARDRALRSLDRIRAALEV